MGIQASNILYAIHGRTILENISLTCEPGTTVALVGPSGCGKTTLLGMLGLLIEPTSGTVAIEGKDRWSGRDRRLFWKRHAAFVYQDYGLVDEENVAYNVTLSRHAVTRSESHRRARTFDSVLARVGMAGRGNDAVVSLSGGEKQRVGIARALWKRADYIFADEPTASLDADNKQLVIDLLRQAADDGAHVILASHDRDIIEQCDHVVDVTASKGRTA